MKSLRRTAVAGFALAGLLAGVVVAWNASAWDSSPLNHAFVAHDYHCGDRDRPEPGLSGQVPKAFQDSGDAKLGYNCGLAQIGFNSLTRVPDPAHPDDPTKDLDSRPAGNANMAWSGQCAYIAGGIASLFNPPVVSKPVQAGAKGQTGVAVVDVHDPEHPAMVKVLRHPGAMATGETIGARTNVEGTRGVLVVGQYGNDPVSDPKPMDIYVYDTSKPCDTLQHIPSASGDPNAATYYWPGNIHNLTVTEDLRYVFATIPIQAVDLSGMWTALASSDPTVVAHAASQIHYIGNLNDSLPGTPMSVGPENDVLNQANNTQPPTHPQETSHEAWVGYTPNGKTILYMGGQTPTGEVLSIVDITQWLQDGKTATVLSMTAGRAHSIRTATIGGKPYLLHSEESVFGQAYGCIPQIAAPFAGVSEPWLTDISDPTHPQLVSQMGLQINEPENCKAQYDDKENDSVHYHDVDDASDTHFVMASMWNSGLRIFDVHGEDTIDHQVHDAAHPTEVAYFNPADIAPAGQPAQLDHAWAHVHYDAENGTIWFAETNSGFYVLRIEEQVRKHLGLTGHVPPAPHAQQGPGGVDLGWPGTTGATFAAPVGGYIDVSPWYCTLAAYRAQAGFGT